VFTPPAYSFQFPWSVREKERVMPLRLIPSGSGVPMGRIIAAVNGSALARDGGCLRICPSSNSLPIPQGAGRCGVFPLPIHSAPFLFQQLLADFIQRLPIPHRFVSSFVAEWKRNRGIFVNVQKVLGEIRNV